VEDAYLYSRIQFAFTVSFHYLFPQLTMGLGLLIVLLKSLALWRGDGLANGAARFLGRIFAIHFALGVVTGIPLEFQFGTNWARFSERAGGIVGQTLAMEGLFAFFLESTFLGLFLFGEQRLGPRGHWLAAFAVFAGSWLSGYFVILTHAWMQHPVGHETLPDGRLALRSLGALFSNPWATWEYLHVMAGAVVTASFVVAGIGALYALRGEHAAHARLLLKLGVACGLAASVLAAFPTGDQQAKNVARLQPVAFAAMEGLFSSERGAGIVLIGQPNMKTRHLDNPIYVPKLLSFLTYASFDAEIKGLDAFPEETWPTNVPGLYYAYHIMAGLGTLFIGLMALAALCLIRGRLFRTRWLLWLLLLAMPFPYIANTAGWWTAELGRQPWIVYGLLRTRDGVSSNLSDGNALFTLIGFVGLYLLLGVLCLALTGREIQRGPAAASGG
jgi:cytochrome d ubiquinol oxidase subunit I